MFFEPIIGYNFYDFFNGFRPWFVLIDVKKTRFTLFFVVSIREISMLEYLLVAVGFFKDTNTVILLTAFSAKNDGEKYARPIARDELLS